MRSAFIIAIKDLKQRARDRSALLMVFVIPVALTLIFSQTLAGVTGSSPELSIAFVDTDNSEIGIVFRDQVLKNLEADGLIVLTVAADEEEATEAISAGNVDAAIVFPSGFAGSIYSGLPEEILVIHNANSFLGPLVADAVAGSFASELNTMIVAAEAAGVDVRDAAVLARVSSELALTQGIVTIDDFSASRKQLDSTTFYSAGMAIFFVFFSVQFGITSLIEERNQGTLPRLVAAPIPSWSILAGKVLSTFIIGVLSMAVLITASTLMVGAEWGNPVGVALLVLLAVLSAMGIMTLVATVTRTVEQAGNAQAIVAVGMGMLGGTFFPVAQIGGLIEKISLLTPHAWFMRGLSGLQSGGDLGDVWIEASAILVFALLTGAIGFARAQKLVSP